MRNIILASTSPRRKALLRQIGLTFTVEPSRYKEDMNMRKSPHALARFLSLQKAGAVVARHPHALVIAADTFIVYQGKAIGKPNNLATARSILRQLSGHKHSVLTGFTIMDGITGRRVSRVIETKVFFRTLSAREINIYVKIRKPLDLAGYAIQELSGIFVKKIEGDYFNVVGLPLCAIAEELKKFGIKVL